MEQPDLPTLLTLAIFAYCGHSDSGTDCNIASEAYGEMLNAASQCELVNGRWTIAWGPAVFKFSTFESHPDNLLVVFQSVSNPSQFVVATSGSNPSSIWDWLVEDGLVLTTMPWAFGKIEPGADPQISLGTFIGLFALLLSTPCEGLPGAGTALVDFLATEGAKAPLNVTVTGHSLGGTLASTLALYLVDTQGDAPLGRRSWDLDSASTISAVTFAAATAGNKDFATHSDNRLGPAVTRIWNSLDVVPHAWNFQTLAEIPDLYKHWSINIPSWLWFALLGVMGLVEGIGYTQVQPTVLPRKGTFYPAKTDFLDQATYQHTTAYLEMFELPDQCILEGILTGQCNLPRIDPGGGASGS